MSPLSPAPAPPVERADAARNRAVILEAAERLLTTVGAGELSIDRIAEEAGVGKGTIFRRFGSRTGLFEALLAQQATEIRATIIDGPPPLGPGAPAPERLVAFAEALAELAERNTTLFSGHEAACAQNKHGDPTYVDWHTHVVDLLEEARPGSDTEFLGHAFLAIFDGELVVRVVDRDGPGGFTRTVGATARELLGV